MYAKIFVVIALIAMIGSLFSAMFFMFKDKGEGTRTVKALSIRVSIWVVLLALIAVGLSTGILKPGNSLIAPRQIEPPKNSTANRSLYKGTPEILKQETERD